MRSKTLALVSTRSQSLSTRPLLDEPVTMDTPVQALDAPRTPPHLSPVPSVEPAPPLPQWRSDELLGSADEALISHGDQVYRLRRTTTGKLILTK
ncbi:hemin uptake protein HemP [Ideonella sp.]|uniref:hemin uptake protein HemP n=1 Tax=Ideonella sp. TaxID=1929293 RepID=UPI0035B1F3CB